MGEEPCPNKPILIPELESGAMEKLSRGSVGVSIYSRLGWDSGSIVKKEKAVIDEKAILDLCCEEGDSGISVV